MALDGNRGGNAGGMRHKLLVDSDTDKIGGVFLTQHIDKILVIGQGCPLLYAVNPIQLAVR